jgi:hypothetical protein
VPAPNFPTETPTHFTATVATDADGKYTFEHMTTGGTYGVCEIKPQGVWIATTVRPDNSYGEESWESNIFCPRHIQFTGGGAYDEAANNVFNAFACFNDPAAQEAGGVALGVGNVDGVEGDDWVNLVPGRGPADFGNVCLVNTGGHTRGFWQNKNGARRWRAEYLNDLYLRDFGGAFLCGGDGSNCDSLDYNVYREWLRNASGKNMAYQLSAQLSALAENVGTGFVDADALIYAPGTPGANSAGFVSVSSLISQAAAALLADGVTLPGDPNRQLQAKLMEAIDKVNNNLQIKLGDVDECTVTYTGSEDCAAGDITNVLAGVNEGIGPLPTLSSATPVLSSTTRQPLAAPAPATTGSEAEVSPAVMPQVQPTAIRATEPTGSKARTQQSMSVVPALLATYSQLLDEGWREAVPAGKPCDAETVVEGDLEAVAREQGCSLAVIDPGSEAITLINWRVQEGQASADAAQTLTGQDVAARVRERYPQYVRQKE